MKKALFIILFFLNLNRGMSQDVMLLLQNLSDTALIKNASVLMQEENIQMEISEIDRCSYKVHQLFTVLNEQGKDALDFVQYSSKQISLEDAEIKVYDANGKQKDKFKKRDMITQATGDGLIEDGFITYYRISSTKYPVTVEFNYEIKFKGTVNIPDYQIMNSGEAIAKSSFTVKVLKDLDIRYKEKNIKLDPVITEDGSYKIYQWNVNKLKPLEYEEGSVQYRGRYPSIRFAPNKFSYYGNPGELTSWKKFGEWIASLYKDLDELPADRKAFFLNMVKDAKTDADKAKLIYNYLQKNFRYVSIQLGIGGLKPFSASFTDQKKYGDCKSLSNYMKAALKAVGVKSYVAIINAEYNSEPVDADFPSNEFDHVILCIPQPKDSIWLECTSNTADFNILGSFTENKNALLITDDGGKLVPTPRSKASANQLNANTTVFLEADGSGKSDITFKLSGSYKQAAVNNLFDEKKDDQKDYLMSTYSFKQPDDFSIEREDNDEKVIANIKMTYSRAPEFIAGNKMFLAPRLYKIWINKLPKAETRRLDYFFRYPFIKTDTTIYKLPEGFSVEALPKNKNLSFDYGNYSANYWYNTADNAVYCCAKLELTQLRIPAAKYAALKTFFDDIMKDEAQRIVIKKQ